MRCMRCERWPYRSVLQTSGDSKLLPPCFPPSQPTLAYTCSISLTRRSLGCTLGSSRSAAHPWPMAALSMASAACCHGLQQDRAASVSQRPTAFPSLQQRHPRLPLRPTAFPSLRQHHPRLPRRPAAATSAAVRAAQKKVYRSFSDMLQQSKEPVLVEFYATWCG